MKIKTITCHHAYNHGAMLQAYALVTYLRSLGHEVEIIDYRPPYQPGCKVERDNVPPRYRKPVVAQLYKFVKRGASDLEQRRRDVYERFFSSYLPITKEQYYSVDELRANPPKADIYIAGSDQIWNTSFPNGTDAAFYLDFGTPARKISYAASFATTSLRMGTEMFVKENLRNFDAISVREESALRLLDQLGFEGAQVVDPVFLLDKSEWNKICNDTGEGDEYILTYDYEKRNSPIGKVAKQLAKLRGCKIYTVAPFNLGYADRCFVAVEPRDFVSLVKNARCVVSNSFHGSAFSMIYGKEFFVVNRKDGLNVRMHDLLARYSVGGRLISEAMSSSDLMATIDYEKVDEVLRKDIIASQRFLQTQIDTASL